MKFKFIFTLIFLLSNSAFAATEIISMTSEIKSSQSVYKATNDGDGTFIQTSSRSVQKTRIKGTGALKAVNQKSSEINTDVLGIDINGHSKISIVQKDGGTYVHVDQLIDDNIGEDGITVKINIKTNYYAEIEFTMGSFSDYENGDYVEFQLTDKGQKAANNQAIAKVRYSMILVKNALQKEIPEIGDIGVDSVKVKGRSVFKGDKRRLEVSGVSIKIKLSMTLRF